MPYEFHDTSHLEKRAQERGFTLEQAMLAINDPGSILKTPPRRGNHRGRLWLYFLVSRVGRTRRFTRRHGRL